VITICTTCFNVLHILCVCVRALCTALRINKRYFVGFEVSTAVLMNSIIFWDMTPCSSSSFNRRFGGIYRLHLQGRRNKFSKTSKQSLLNHQALINFLRDIKRLVTRYIAYEAFLATQCNDLYLGDRHSENGICIQCFSNFP
jgi:hypothetical protein